MKTEKVPYSAGALNCEGVLVYDEAGKNLPLLLMAPNWMGVTEKAIEGAKELAEKGYVVFLADMYGPAGRPTGQEAPMEFLGPLIKQPAETRARINAAFDAMTAAAKARGVGDHRLLLRRSQCHRPRPFRRGCGGGGQHARQSQDRHARRARRREGQGARGAWRR